MRTVFVGSGELGLASCQLIAENLAQLVGLVTLPERSQPSPSSSIFINNSAVNEFRKIAEQKDCPFYIAPKLDDIRSDLERISPDLILVVGWYAIISRTVLQIPRLGTAALHASLLPRYRGGAPLVWAMINGEKESGVSLFFMTEKVDEGDVIGQKRFTIEPQDMIRDALEKARQAALHLLAEQIPLVKNGKNKRTAQDPSKATYYPMRCPEDGKIDLSWSCKQIRNFIRAQSKPYPGAFLEIEGKRLTIWDADIFDL